MSGPELVPPSKLSRLPKLPKTVPNQFAGHRLRIVRVESSSGVPAKPAPIGIKAPFPGFIEPEPATSVHKVPSGQRWICASAMLGKRLFGL
jgi:hypothetical protein